MECEPGIPCKHDCKGECLDKLTMRKPRRERNPQMDALIRYINRSDYFTPESILKALEKSRSNIEDGRTRVNLMDVLKKP